MNALITMATSLHTSDTTSERRTLKFKFAVLGDKHVGKTSLLKRFVTGSFNNTYLQTSDMFEKTVDVNGYAAQLTMIDSAGHEYARTLIKSLYKNVHGIMLVYDVTSKSTFESLDEWLRQIEDVNTRRPYIVLVGNKNDVRKHKTVTTEQAAAYADAKKLPFMEVSAKTGRNADDVFQLLVQGTFTDKIATYNQAVTIRLSEEKQAVNEEGGFQSKCCS